jgi:amino-acid N-acetyltransferase
MGLAGDQAIISLDKSYLSNVEALLQKCKLPYEDCNQHLDKFFGITSGDKLVAIGALQIKGTTALLRSIAVLPENRGLGLAAAMTRHLLGVARSNEVSELYLLTETAEGYFTRFGFHPVERDTVPTEIKSTQQFESLCPSSAQLMRLDL